MQGRQGIGSCFSATWNQQLKEFKSRRDIVHSLLRNTLALKLYELGLSALQQFLLFVFLNNYKFHAWLEVLGQTKFTKQYSSCLLLNMESWERNNISIYGIIIVGTNKEYAIYIYTKHFFFSVLQSISSEPDQQAPPANKFIWLLRT